LGAWWKNPEGDRRLRGSDSLSDCGRVVANSEVVEFWLDGSAKGNRRSFTAQCSVQDDKRKVKPNRAPDGHSERFAPQPKPTL
jgi:hypothetical protein